MAGNKKVFKSPYVGIDDTSRYPFVYDVRGNYSVFIKTQNPCVQYNGDIDNYYLFQNLFTNMLRSLDSGYGFQKHDIFTKRLWKEPESSYGEDDLLLQKHFEIYKDRICKYQSSVIILTCEVKHSFFGYDDSKHKSFLNNVDKVISYLSNSNIKAVVMSKKEMVDYIYRYFSMDFEDDACSFDNFSVKADGIRIGMKNIQCLSLIDVELVEMPNTVKPYSTESIGNRQFPHDALRFVANIDAETVVYNQVVFTVSQSVEKAKLEAKMKRHSSVPDPANTLCVEDIVRSMEDIERNGQLLVYTHYDIIIADKSALSRPRNQIETFLANLNIRMSKQAFNQYELFRSAAPGNMYELRNYDKFLTTLDVAVSLMYKERLPVTEISNLMMWFTDRHGVPISVDPSDLPMRTQRITNRNKFVLGPSGTGKSFLMNTMLHQYLLTDTDVVLVDIGHSYLGLCNYFNGRYITYSEENPISMNPFYILRVEYNIEKVDFLINLIMLLWKEKTELPSKTETDIVRECVMGYYANFFAYQGEFNEDVAAEYRLKMVAEWEKEEVHDEDCSTLDELNRKIEKFISEQQTYYEKEKDNLTVKDLSFNSFYEFAKERIPKICQNGKLKYDNQHNNDVLDFHYNNFMFVLKKFYKGGVFEKILNNKADRTLFDEKLVVFEIDSIQDNPTLFPIVTLVIMDVFIQKMRNKLNRKVMIIEEAWKALASELMANYIKYLYKTVRKFYGEAITVTQELDDILKSNVVRESIVANSASVVLLDQTSYKDNFTIIADILSLSEVEQNKIFTINNLDNKGGRGIFKEFYLKRGTSGEVYGNEVSLYEYYTYTTEKPEKDAVLIYKKVYKTFVLGLDAFINDLVNLKLPASDFITLINSEYVSKHTSQGSTHFEDVICKICKGYRDAGSSVDKYIYQLNSKLSYEEGSTKLLAV
jgi:hypothetical protein